MKKLLFLTVLTVFTLACSSDSDDSNNGSSDPIIAKWSLEKEVFYNSDNTTVNYEQDADACESMCTYEYKSNNTVSTVLYSENTGSCELDNIEWTYYNWTNLGNDMYQFTSKVSGESEESYSNKVTFAGGKMIIEDTYFDGSTNNKRESVYIKL